MSCQPCPANTNLLLSGGNATICPCLDGFFRTTYEGPSDKCSCKVIAIYYIYVTLVADIN